jgi:hypothetical protein
MRFLRAEMAERMVISAFLIAPGITGRARGPPSTKHADEGWSSLSSLETVLMQIADDDSRF